MRWRTIYMKRRSDALTCVRFSQYDGQTTCSTPFIVCTFLLFTTIKLLSGALARI